MKFLKKDAPFSLKLIKKCIKFCKNVKNAKILLKNMKNLTKILKI